jgi:hypothetical protein
MLLILKEEGIMDNVIGAQLLWIADLLESLRNVQLQFKH